jgi:WD40 repeat protein
LKKSGSRCLKLLCLFSLGLSPKIGANPFELVASQPLLAQVIALSADGRQMAVAVGDRITLYSLPDWKVARTWTGNGDIVKLEFSITGSSLLWVSQGNHDIHSLAVQDTENGTERFQLQFWRNKTGFPIVFSPQGQFLTFISELFNEVTKKDESYISVADVAADTALYQVALEFNPEAIASSYDGKTLAFARGTQVKFLNTLSTPIFYGEEVDETRPDRHRSPIQFLAFSPDGAGLVSAGTQPDTEPRFWDASKKDFLWKGKGLSKDPVKYGQFSRNGHGIVTQQGSRLCLWEVYFSSYSSRDLGCSVELRLISTPTFASEVGTVALLAREPNNRVVVQFYRIPARFQQRDP